MFLKNLTIKSQAQGQVIQEITFHKGINLIIDETSSTHRQETGNSVGKTTVLRLIDFCLGGEGKNIYKDPEFKEKGSNAAIESFLKKNYVVITLVLKEDLEISSSPEITIRRNFASRQKKILEINGKSYSRIQDFREELGHLIFDTRQPKPSFRQIISKNIRDERNRLQHTLKVLDGSTTTEAYEALYLFWLGIETDSAAKKQELSRQLKEEERLYKRLEQENNLSQVEQALLVLQRDIDALEKQKDSLGVHEAYEADVDRLNAVKHDINSLHTRKGQLELRKGLILESKAELEKWVSHVDTEQVQFLYKEAQLLIPNLQKTFEETLSFHNAMLAEKKRFIEDELPDLELKLKVNKASLQELLKTEKALSKKLQKSKLFDVLQGVITKLNQAYEQKGRYEEQKQQLEEAIKRIKEYKNDLEKIDKEILSQDELITKRVTLFNTHFSDISFRLYGEHFILSSEKKEKGYGLSISTVSGNPGTGKKKGEMLSFDLAYIQFSDALGLKCLHFVLHDQIETVHDNQLTNLLTEIVQEVDCQLVLPVLKDKLPSDIDVSALSILSLSQSSKLFKV